MARGGMLWYHSEIGYVVENWLAADTPIPGKAYMWTWGVGGNPMLQADFWHFEVLFAANDTARVQLLWNMNESVLFNEFSSEFSKSFDIPIPPESSSWRWDWLIQNPHETFLLVKNFTVTHYSIRYPERTNGTVAIGLGSVLLAAGLTMFVHPRRQRSQPR